MTTGPRRRNFAVRNEAIRSVDPKRKLFVNDGYEKNTDEDWWSVIKYYINDTHSFRHLVLLLYVF